MKLGGYLMIVMGVILFFDWMTKIISVVSEFVWRFYWLLNGKNYENVIYYTLIIIQ